MADNDYHFAVVKNLAELGDLRGIESLKTRVGLSALPQATNQGEANAPKGSSQRA